MMMADYAQAEAGKLNIIGATVTVIGRAPDVGVTVPFSLVVLLEVPPDHYGEECAFKITLEDASGALVTVPGTTPGDEPQPVVQINQTARFAEPTPSPHLRFPEQYRQGYLPARVYLVIGFPNGLPLASGEGYRWRVTLDNQARDEWTAGFVVAEQVSQQLSSS